MSQNPFDALGGSGGAEGAGGFDMNALLQQAQQMQEGLAKAQEELAQAEVEGTSGGVAVRITGGGDLLSVNLQPGQFDGSDPEALEDLSDLIVAAFRDAKARADQLAAEKLGPMTEGLGGGGGLPGLGL